MTSPLAALSWPRTTARLSIRPATPDDVEATWAYRRLPAVAEWITAAPDNHEECSLAPADGVSYLACQTARDYVPPVWPTEPGAQQMMLHLDFEVTDLPSAVRHALDVGARLADPQPQDDVRVMLDPDGHPFCLYTS